jgi:hypothetical protein
VNIGDAIHRTVMGATKKWADVEKKTIRDKHRGVRALERYYRGVVREPSIKEAAFSVLSQSYAKASGGGRYPATARQVMYAARPLIVDYTDKPLGKDFDSYFTQTLLPEYIREHPDETASWDVVYDARGHFTEPHTKKIVSLGTLHVRRYLAGAHDVAKAAADEIVEALDLRYPTSGPNGRYRDVLFLEKEGFNDLLAASQIAERFDLAIMSTKGYSSTSARTLMECLDGVRILVLHDFDKDGLGILHTFRHDTTRYQFTQPPDIIDLGIRLADVKAERLEAEPVTYSKNPTRALTRYGATAREIDFLLTQHQRVELNAFMSDHFIAWLERKLKAHGVKKVIPDTAMLVSAYRRAVMLNDMNNGLADLEKAARKVSDEAAIPKARAKQIKARLAKAPALAWDDAVAELAEEAENGRSVCSC